MDNHLYPTRGEYSIRAKAVDRQYSLRIRQLVEKYGLNPIVNEVIK